MRSMESREKDSAKHKEGQMEGLQSEHLDGKQKKSGEKNEN